MVGDGVLRQLVDGEKLSSFDFATGELHHVEEPDFVASAALIPALTFGQFTVSDKLQFAKTVSTTPNFALE